MNPAGESLRRLYGPECVPFAATHTWSLHDGLVHGIAVLPGGAHYVSASEDGTLKVVSLADGEVLQRLVGHDGPVNSLCLTPDGTHLVTGGDDHTVRVWNTSTWEQTQVLAGHGGYVREVACSDSLVVSGAEDDTVRFWDLARGEALQVGEAHREDLRTVAISSDGRLAASSGLDNQLIVWDVASGEVLRTLYDGEAAVVRPTGMASLYIATGNASGHGHQGGPRRLIFVDGGRTLISVEHEVIFWAVESGAETRRWPRWGWEHEAVALHPEGRLIALGGNGYVQIWDVAAGVCVTTLGRGGEQVTALAFAPDGRWLLAGSNKGVVQVWDFEAGLRADDGGLHRHSVTNLVVEGSRALTGDTGGGVILWDLDLPGPIGPLDVEFEANGRPLALGEGVALTAESRGFAVWDARTGALRRRLQSDADADERAPEPHALLPLPGERALVGHLSEGLALWTLDGTATALRGATRQNSVLAVAPDGRHAVSRGYFERAEDRARAEQKSGGGYVYVPSVSQLQGWDLETGELLWTVAAGPAGGSYVDFVFCVFTPDGRLVTRSATDERAICFWDVRTGAVVQTVAVSGTYPAEARIVGRELVLLVFHNDFPCRVTRIDLGSGVITRVVSIDGLAMNGRISPDGSRIVAAKHERLDVYDASTGEVVAQYECGADVRELGFADDGRRIVIGDQAGRVHVLELDGFVPAPVGTWTEEELEVLRGVTEAVVEKKLAAAAKSKGVASRGGKSAAPKAAATRSAGTKTAVKKTAVKKAAVKKTAVKKTAVKKTAVKKAAAKKTAVKKTAAKKTAAKK